MPINDEEDCVVLQNIASTFYDLCSRLGLELNVEKCFFQSVSKSSSTILYDYLFGSRAIGRVNLTKDLEIMFNSRFTFKDDLTFRISKARSMMGFIKRQACEFKNPSVLKSL